MVGAHHIMSIPKLTTPPELTVKPLDLTRRMDVYKGDPDGDDWNQPISVPMGMPRWDFTLAEIDRQDFQQLQALLGEANFQTIVGTQGYSQPQNPGESYRGDDDLPMRYYLRKTDQANVQELILVGFGEFQPCRWFAHIEGIWYIHRTNPHS
jgi:hypothetical protein